MPLQKSSSDKALKHNVSTEIKSGVPEKQALAIAYAVKNGKHKKKTHEAYVRYFKEDSDEVLDEDEDSEFSSWLHVVLDEYDKWELIDMLAEYIQADVDCKFHQEYEHYKVQNL